LIGVAVKQQIIPISALRGINGIEWYLNCSDHCVPSTQQVAEETNTGKEAIRLAREYQGVLEFAGPAILRTPSHARAEWQAALCGRCL
jgi:hypothetical protein